MKNGLFTLVWTLEAVTKRGNLTRLVVFLAKVWLLRIKSEFLNGFVIALDFWVWQRSKISSQKRPWSLLSWIQLNAVQCHFALCWITQFCNTQCVFSLIHTNYCVQSWSLVAGESVPNNLSINEESKPTFNIHTLCIISSCLRVRLLKDEENWRWWQ